MVGVLARESPAIFTGQEFESLGAQNEFIKLARKAGYQYFLRDLGSNDPIRNNSGLFVASKVPLKEIQFAPYPMEDREGLAKWSNQGALSFAVSLGEDDLRFVNVHLNYGEGEKNQAARNRQLTKHVVPLIKDKRAVLLGDFNFDTSKVDRNTSGLQGFKNELEGRVTCTDEGKHILRGKSRRLDGKPCADCKESIDGLVYDPGTVKVSPCWKSKLLQVGKWLLSDHFATIATLSIQGKLEVE
ncbi:MAG: hypothetical protein A3E80_04255 [Chlamydiae bacterium RIFCSPHIGHO2_12_FULL_49_9]|nr:MAG: hypothetical protein A3E80_04255 [Chlamydiae bacterium RIFCSPHIGHO2_12_FULL_49_9]